MYDNQDMVASSYGQELFTGAKLFSHFILTLTNAHRPGATSQGFVYLSILHLRMATSDVPRRGGVNEVG